MRSFRQAWDHDTWKPLLQQQCVLCNLCPGVIRLAAPALNPRVPTAAFLERVERSKGKHLSFERLVP